MKSRINFLFVFMFLVISSLSQSQELSLNFIIQIDNKIDISLINTSFIVDDKEYPVTYSPGILVIRKDVYEKIKADQDVKLKFTWNNVNYRNYIVDFNSNLINRFFFILSVYNLDNKCYQKIFGKQKKDVLYIFEISSSVGSELLPRKSSRHKCFCLD